MEKNLHLQRFEANSFMGIDKESPVVIDFTKRRKGQAITNIRGDQGTGKTSTLTSLMHVMGAVFDFETKHLVNMTDEDIDVTLSFEHDGLDHVVTASPGRLVLKQKLKGSDKFVSLPSPKDTLRTIFGNLGVSPMFLKNLKGKDQIEWFKRTFGTDEEATKKEIKLTADLKKAMEERKEVNRDIKNLKGAIEVNPLHANYEKNAKKFAEKKDSKKEKEKLDQLKDKYEEFQKSESGLVHLKSNRDSYKKQIEQLEQQLKTLNDNLGKTETRITEGEKYLKDNKNVKDDYEKANEEWMNISKHLADQERWAQLNKDMKRLDEMEQLVVSADSTIDKARAKLKELVATYLPKIKGLEIRVKISIDDEDEGIYYNEMSLAQLSESEIWDLFLLIWEDKDVQFIFCDNANVIGSQAVATLNRLAKEGAEIFAVEMDRKLKEREISFATKIE